MGNVKALNMDNSKYCKFLLILSIVSICFFFGYQFTCLNPLVPVLDSLYNQTYYDRYGEELPHGMLDLLRSLTFSMLLAGAFVGSLTVNTILKLVSRKHVMILLHTLVIIGTLTISLGCGLTGSYEAFILGRFIIGYSLGCGVTVLSLVTGETCVYHRQSFYNTIIGIGLALADFSGPCFAHPKVLGSSKLWPVMISLTMIPSVVYLICSPWISETAYEVLRRDGREKAKQLLRKLRVTEGKDDLEELLEGEIQKMEFEQSGSKKLGLSDIDNEEKSEENTSPDAFVGFKEILTTKQYRWQLFGVVALYGFEMLCGINNVFFYSDTIFLQAGIAEENVTFGTIGGLAMMIVGSNFGTYMAGKYGEKKVFIGMGCVICFGTILIVISLATVHLAQGMAYVSIIGVIVTFFGFAGGPNVTIWSLGVSITTEPTRPNILLCGGAVMWFGGWLVGFVAPYLRNSTGPYGLLIWVALSVILIIYTHFYIPDTKGKSSEEIQKKFK